MKERENTIPENDHIIIYRKEDISLEINVRYANETIWLTQEQIAILFGVKRPAITKHLKNIYDSGELDADITCSILERMGNDGKQLYQTKYYNLDVILSVGYRVNSKFATQFRIWANRVIKEYLFRGQLVDKRFEVLETRMLETENKVANIDDQFQKMVQQALPPRQGIFYDGQIFDAFNFVSDLVRSAKRRIVLIDNYVDDSVLAMLDVREEAVTADIYTNITPQLKLANKQHTAQYPKKSVRVHDFRLSHDRWLLIDDGVYLFGASLKDLGKKWFGFALLQDVGVEEIMRKIKSCR